MTIFSVARSVLTGHSDAKKLSDHVLKEAHLRSQIDIKRNLQQYVQKVESGKGEPSNKEKNSTNEELTLIHTNGTSLSAEAIANKWKKLTSYSRSKRSS